MAKINFDVDKMTETQAKELLKELIRDLDELDGEDFFGTEGWRHFLGYDQ